MYYQKVALKEEDLILEEAIMRIYLEMPYYGYRRISEELRRQGYHANRKRIRRIMHDLGIQAIYPKPNLSIANQRHKKYPYLQRGLPIDPQKITIADISKTYQCPLAKRVRKHLSKRGIKKGVPTVYSYEKPIKIEAVQTEPTRDHRTKNPVGTISYIPAMMGMWAASYVLRSLAGYEIKLR